MYIDIIKSKIRIFSLQTKDPGMICRPDLSIGYLVSLLVDKVGINFFNISLETIYPFKKYSDFLLNNLSNFKEDYFLFFLENYYHSSNYSLLFLKKILKKLSENKQKVKIIIHSLKLWKEEWYKLMQQFDFIHIIVNTDIEYFFNELLYKKTPINEITNILYRNNKWEIIINSYENVEYNLEEYIIWWYYNWYILRLTNNSNYIKTLLDNDNETTNDAFYYKTSKNKKIESIDIYSRKNTFDISTWRWCKYKCIYCYRWVKYSTIRQIPLYIIKKDLDYLDSIWVNSINIYDDCFLTTNNDRLSEIVELLWSYNFSYQIAVRYEICTPNNFKLLSKLKLDFVQIWLQSVSKNTNIMTWRNLDMDNFSNIINKFKSNWIYVSLDTILGLPWESKNDFLRTFKFALSLEPNNITVNTLFFNPWTELYKKKEELWIIAKKDKLFNVWSILESKTFSNKDIIETKEYLWKISQKLKNISFTLR